MPRIRPLQASETGPIRRLIFHGARRRVGRVPEPLAVVAHHPAMLAGQVAFELALDRARGVDHRLLELAQLKAATLSGCPFCMDIGSWIARGTGVSEAQLRDLARHRESPHFDDDERLVLDYAVAMTRTPVEVSDELFARLRARFDERQVLELTSAIAWENFRGRFNHALGIGAQGFSEGAFCALPEAVPPAVADAA